MARKYRECTAFSLIELIVVIAIVAILAAIAVPVYQNYAIAGSLGKAVPIVRDFIEKQRLFWNLNGRFPTPSEMATQYGTTASGNFFNGTISDYISSVYTFPTTNGAVGCTTNIGALSMGLNLTALNINSNIATSGHIDCYVFNRPGEVISYCAYYLQAANGDYLTGNFIPTWYGCREKTCSSPNPYSQMKDGYGGLWGYLGATCN